MGDWFLNPLGGNPLAVFSSRRKPEPVEPGEYVCDRCGAPLVPCDRCGRPATCGDTWCELCHPDG